MATTRKPTPLGAEALYDYALKTLGGRPHSTSELRNKLRRKAEKLGDVDGVLSRLKEHGFLNDRQFAEHYAARRLENEGFGKSRVVYDLRQRRVAPQLAERAAEAAYATTDEVELIEKFLARKYRSNSLAKVLADRKGLAAAYRRLRYAGFSSANSISVLKRYAKEAELLDGMEEGGDEELRRDPD